MSAAFGRNRKHIARRVNQGQSSEFTLVPTKQQPPISKILYPERNRSCAREALVTFRAPNSEAREYSLRFTLLLIK